MREKTSCLFHDESPCFRPPARLHRGVQTDGRVPRVAAHRFAAWSLPA